MEITKNKQTATIKSLLMGIPDGNKEVCEVKTTRTMLYLFLTICLLSGSSLNIFAQSKSYSKTVTASATVGSENVIVKNTIYKDSFYPDDDQIILYTQTNYPSRNDLVTYVRYQYRVYVQLKSPTSGGMTYQIFDRAITYFNQDVNKSFDRSYHDYAHYLTTFINGEQYVGTKIVFTCNITITTRFSNGQTITSSLASLEQ